MSIYTPQITMKMLTDLRKKIVENTQIIDFAISKYFANRLGVKDIKTIIALETKSKCKILKYHAL